MQGQTKTETATCTEGRSLLITATKREATEEKKISKVLTDDVVRLSTMAKYI